MRDMAELLQSHQVVNLHGLRLADAIDVVTRKVHEHDMFCPVLL